MRLGLVGLAAAVVGCGGASTSAVTVEATADPVAVAALEASGTSDGWTIRLDRALLSVASTQAASVTSTSRHVLDLLSSSPTALANGDLSGALCPAVEFIVRAPEPGAAEGDLGFMATHGYAVYVEGAASRGGVSKAFHWGFSAATKHTCRPSVALTGAPTTVALTFDVTTLFLDDLVSPKPRLAFELIAKADSNSDGVVDESELRTFDISAEDRYQVGSTRIDRLWDFIEYLAGDIGDIPGQSVCDVETLASAH